MSKPSAEAVSKTSPPSRSPLDSGGHTRHPLGEILKRSRDPAFVGDAVLRILANAWVSFSPLEFSVLHRRIRSHTMCSNARQRGLYRAVHHVVRAGVPGDVVECGCARGGSAALMALTLKHLGAQRRMWLFDTFEGLPAPTEGDPDYEIADLFTGSCFGALDEVQHLFDRLDVARDLHLVKGLFQDTLSRAPIQQIALLHIDGDWYESVKVCLETLYDKVAPGGMIQFDDYGYWKGARKAVDEFMRERGIQSPLRRLDYSGRSMKKTASSI